MSTKVDTLRRKLAKLPGTHAEKAKLIGSSVSWVTKFLAGDIEQPRAKRYEQLLKKLA